MKQNENAKENSAVRLDLWLWAARFFKTRALAKQSIEAGRVEIDGQSLKPAKLIRVGEQLHIRRGDELMIVDVLNLAFVRGSASVAQTLYRETEASLQARLAMREQKRLANAGYQAPKSKPDKRARRLIQALGDLDSL